MGRKEAVAFARQGETLRLMGTQKEDEEGGQKLFEDATSLFERAIDADSTYAWAWAHLGATLSYQGGMCKRRTTEKLDLYSQAEDRFKRATELNSSYTWAWAQRGQNYCWWGIYYKEEDRGQQAIEFVENSAINECFNKAIGLDPTYVWALAKRSFAYRILGLFKGEDSQQEQPNYDLAVADLEKVIKLNHNYAWALAMLAVVHRQKARAYDSFSRVDKARDEWIKVYDNLEKAVKIYPDIFKPPKQLEIGYMFLPKQGSSLEFPENASKYQYYTMAGYKAYKEGYLAAEEDINTALKALAE
ncbi:MULTISPECIES: hypothetical protein [unclassified Microcoleus]|uniref:hypothetical protein n=1 Tax=unclassified Microcoleus TaxID=2642155 RepID=UPI002FD511D7